MYRWCMRNDDTAILLYLESYSYGVVRHFQHYFSYIVAVSFIGGRNRSTREKHHILFRTHLLC
jgi:hypothetical protein